MTTAPVSQPFMSGSFLFADTGIASALEASGAADVVRRQLAGFTQATRNEAVKEIERITAEVTNLNLIDVILDAVSTYRELRDAGMRTISAPDSSELVELIGHQVTLENQPSIQLIVNGKQVANVHLLLSLVIEIQALTATVRYGRLTALQIGRCDVGASVGIEGTTVAHRQSQLQLPLSIPLGAGLPLGTPRPSDARATSI